MAIRIAEVKSSRLSDDKKEVIVDAGGKYIGSIELRFARECLDPLIDALTRAKSSLEPSANAGVASNALAAPAPKHNGGAVANPDEVRFQVPKNLTVHADTSARGTVLLLANERLETRGA